MSIHHEPIELSEEAAAQLEQASDPKLNYGKPVGFKSRGMMTMDELDKLNQEQDNAINAVVRERASFERMLRNTLAMHQDAGEANVALNSVLSELAERPLPDASTIHLWTNPHLKDEAVDLIYELGSEPEIPDDQMPFDDKEES